MNKLELAEIMQQLRFTLETEVSSLLGIDTSEADIIIVATLVTAFSLLLLISIIARKHAVLKVEQQQEYARQEQKRQEIIKQAIQSREQNLKKIEPSAPVKADTTSTVTELLPKIVITTPVMPVKPALKFAAHVPQDSMLRRHYVTQLRSMLETITFPQPTDCALRRHYQQLITSQLELCLTDKAAMEKLLDRYQAHKTSLAVTAVSAKVESESSVAVKNAVFVPQDSMLRRHYLTQVRSMLEALTFPRPADCMLRRHYEQLINSALEEVLADQAKMACLLNRYAEYQENLAIQRNLPLSFAQIPVENGSPSQVETVVSEETPFIPEDATLRRHYVTNLRTMFEALIFSRPSDCVLRRHYEQFVNSQVEDCLHSKTQLERLIEHYEEFKHNLMTQNYHSHSH